MEVYNQLLEDVLPKKETVKFTPLKLQSYTAHGYPYTTMYTMDFSHVVSKDLRTEAPISLDNGLCIQVVQFKGLGPGNFADTRLLVTRKGISEEFNDVTFDFNCIRVKARIIYQECSSNIDFQVYRNGNYKMSLGSLKKFPGEAGTFPIMVRDGLLTWFSPTDSQSMKEFKFVFDTIFASFQFNGHPKNYQQVCRAFPENITAEPELDPNYHIIKLDGIDPNLFLNTHSKNYGRVRKGPGRWPIQITSSGVVMILRAWSVQQIESMYDVICNFIQTMNEKDVLTLDGFADTTIPKYTKKKRAMNFKTKSKEELIEILKRMGCTSVPIPPEGVGIAKNLLVSLAEQKATIKEEEITTKQEDEMEDLLDHAMTDLENNKENEDLFADESLYESPPAKKREVIPAIEKIAMEASQVFRDKNINNIIH